MFNLNVDYVILLLWFQEEISIAHLCAIKCCFRIASPNARSVERVAAAGAHRVAIESLAGASPATAAAASSSAASVCFAANATHSRASTRASLSTRQTTGQHRTDALSSRKKSVQLCFTFVPKYRLLSINFGRYSVHQSAPRQPPGPPLPRPVIPRERSAVDRLVEFLVGDGPSNRYALICKACHSHNGMALKEEFEYLSESLAYSLLLMLKTC